MGREKSPSFLIRYIIGDFLWKLNDGLEKFGSVDEKTREFPIDYCRLYNE